MKKFIAIFALLLTTQLSAGTIGPGAFQESDLLKYFDSLNVNMLYRSANSGALGISATSTNVLTAATVNYLSNGEWKSFGASANIAVPALGVQAASQYAKYLVAVNESGAVLITRGQVSPYVEQAELPNLLSGYTPLGYFQVLTNSSTTYTPGTTPLNAAGLTVTYVNIGAMTSGKYKISLTNR